MTRAKRSKWADDPLEPVDRAAVVAAIRAGQRRGRSRAEIARRCETSTQNLDHLVGTGRGKGRCRRSLRRRLARVCGVPVAFLEGDWKRAAGVTPPAFLFIDYALAASSPDDVEGLLDGPCPPNAFLRCLRLQERIRERVASAPRDERAALDSGLPDGADSLIQLADIEGWRVAAGGIIGGTTVDALDGAIIATVAWLEAMLEPWLLGASLNVQFIADVLQVRERHWERMLNP